ncbi:leucine-rich repeat domain-containing protein [Chloroflexota bacterium]
MRCLSCGHDNPPEARFCANCGAALEAEVKPPPMPSVRCGVCGQDNDPEAAFCSNCGSPLATTVEPLQPRVVAKPFIGQLKWILVGGLSLLIMFQIIYSFTFLLKPSPPPPIPPPRPVPAPVPVPPPSPEVTIPPIVYVDSNYKGISTGTKERPFTKIQAGIVRSSGIVRVVAGIYREQVDLKDYIVLLGAGPDKTVIYGNVFARDVTGARICGFTITDDDTAGIHCYSSSLTIANNIITNQPHAGIHIENSSLTIINNVLAGNGDNGLLILDKSSEATLRNNIIIDNRQCGVEVAKSASCFMDYNVMWNNSGCDYGGNVEPGPHELSTEPLFIDAARSDFRLRPGSPCIDAGDPEPQYNDTDGSRNDIGAFGGPTPCTEPAATTPTLVGAEAVTFPNKNLASAIRDVLGTPPGDNITAAELATLRTLDASKHGIADLTGIEYCVNLRELHLSENQISDITPLENLTNLTWLGLHENQISDITPLENLTNLTWLGLHENQISDISPLANLTSLIGLSLEHNEISDITPLSNLTNLTELYFQDNQISDIGSLENLTNLTELHLQENQISDISTLAKLTKLTWLRLNENQISDIWPLVENSGLGEGDEVELEDNELNLSKGSKDMEYIEALEDKGVDVHY